ncbi:MAG: fatty acid desaturase [Porticoccaceae bacterium]
MAFTFSTTTREVLEQVVREPRFQELTKLPLLAPMEIGLGIAAFTLFGTGSWLYLSGEINFLLMLLINSTAVYVSFTPLHDATHRSVSRNRKINDLIGTLCCLLLLPGITTRIYRYLHLEHHRFTGNRSKDPDEQFVSSSPITLPFVLAGLDVVWLLFYFRHWYSRPRNERIEFLVCLTFYIGVHVLFLLSPYALEFFLCFMIPQRIGLFYVAWFFAHIQHPEGVEWEQAPFQTTVLVKTNVFTSWMLLGQAFHCLHHLAPSIPWYRYKKAWSLGEHLFERQCIPTRTLWRKSRDLKLPLSQTQSWLSASVIRVEVVSDGTYAYDLVPANQDVWPAFEAGAHIDVKLDDGQLRQYSLCNAPSDEQRYRIAVKLDQNGAGGSKFMHMQVNQGGSLEISKPRNNFPLSDDYHQYLLVAGGIGVTPLLAMAYELHEKKRSFELHLFAHTESGAAFHGEIADLPFANSIVLHYSVENSTASTDKNSAARANIVDAIKRYESGLGLYLCGPSGFMTQVMAESKSKGWPAEHMFSETFVPAKIDASENKPFEVKIASTGEVLVVAADEQLIDVLHRHGYAVMCSCTQGICGSCITPVIEGVPEHRDAIMGEAQRAANDRMTVCVSRSRSELIVLDL